MTAEEDYENKKSLIIGEMTTFSLYGTMLVTVPSIVASLFVGNWTDKNINAKKILLIAGAIATISEAVLTLFNIYFIDQSEYLILVAMIPNVFTGGLIAIVGSAWTYIASTTPPELRSLRLTIAEITSAIGQPLGTYFGGLILNTSPMFNNRQLHNFGAIFIVVVAMYSLVLIWTIFMVNEERDIKEFEKRFNKNSETNCKEVMVCEDNKQIKSNQKLFDLNHVKEMFKTCCKRRTNYVRLQIWLSFLSAIIFNISHVGPIIFMFQFAQKVYSWNSETYSNFSALGNIIDALATIMIAPILIKVFKLHDTVLSMIGLCSYFAQNMIRGLLLNASGFYISIVPGCLGTLGSIGVRSHFSKIVDRNELGKVNSLSTVITAIMPLIAAGFFTTVFNATMNTLPGLSFILTALLLIIPFVIVTWIHFYTKLPGSSHIESDKNSEIPNV